MRRSPRKLIAEIATALTIATPSIRLDNVKFSYRTGKPALEGVTIDVPAGYSVMEGALKTPLSGEAKNFLQTLIDNDRVVALPEIAAQFRELANSAAGSADAVIYSAFEMNASQVESLTAMLEKRFACKLTPAVVVDQSLIGGVRVVVGDQDHRVGG